MLMLLLHVLRSAAAAEAMGALAVVVVSDRLRYEKVVSTLGP